MFLPIKTEAHDGRFRMGALAIIGICFIVHVLVQQDFARRQEQLTQLQDQVSRDSIDTHVTDMIKEYAGDNGLSDSTTISNHIEKMKSQSEVLNQVRKQTLFYKLALVSDDFNPINLITNLFTHSGWMHLIGNMWFFYLLGVTMEKYWGLGKFIGIYLGIGVLGNLAFLIVNGLGGKEVGIPVVGASGAIAGMMGAFAVTHGEAKVTMFIMGGFRGSTFQISSRLYLAFWILTQIAEAFWNKEQAGGVAYSAHIVGFLSGMAAGKFIKGDVFYSKAYQVDEGPKIWKQFVKDEINVVHAPLHVDQKTSSSNYPTAPIASASRDNELIVFINQGWSAFELGDIVKASETIFLGIDKAFNTPQFSNTELEAQLKKVMESWNQLKMPSGTLYGWARRMEQREWWTWAIYFYDYAGADESGGTNLHVRQNSILKAAAIRMDRGIERERAIQGFQWIISALPDSSLAEEAKARLVHCQA